MHRRHFLYISLLASAHVAGLRAMRSSSPSSRDDEGWRTFEVTTSVQVLQPSGETRVWLPKPIAGNVPYQRTLSTTVHADGGTATPTRRDADALEMIGVHFPAIVSPIVTIVSRVSTRDYAVNLAAPTTASAPSSSLDYFRRSTKLLPTTGIVRTSAL